MLFRTRLACSSCESGRAGWVFCLCDRRRTVRWCSLLLSLAYHSFSAALFSLPYLINFVLIFSFLCSFHSLSSLAASLPLTFLSAPLHYLLLLTLCIYSMSHTHSLYYACHLPWWAGRPSGRRKVYACLLYVLCWRRRRRCLGCSERWRHSFSFFAASLLTHALCCLPTCTHALNVITLLCLRWSLPLALAHTLLLPTQDERRRRHASLSSPLCLPYHSLASPQEMEEGRGKPLEKALFPLWVPLTLCPHILHPVRKENSLPHSHEEEERSEPLACIKEKKKEGERKKGRGCLSA